jgi:hypothetical protein
MRLYRFVYRPFGAENDEVEYDLFECVAENLTAAEARVANYGCRDAQLVEEADVDPSLAPEVVHRRMDENPWLGPRWAPLQRGIEHRLSTLEREDGVFIEIFRDEGAVVAGESITLDAGIVDDGTLQIQLKWNTAHDGLPSGDWDDALGFLQWRPWPHDEPTRLLHARYLRDLDPGWTDASATEEILVALASVIGVTPDHLFSFWKGIDHILLEVDVVPEVDGPHPRFLFRLPAA